MLFDTDVLIWSLRGNKKAASTIEAEKDRRISIINYMELIQGSRNKNELRLIRAFLNDLGFTIVSLSEHIGHRASIYMEEFSLSSQLSMPDALIAATSVEYKYILCSGNIKHYRSISELELKTFRP